MTTSKIRLARKDDRPALARLVAALHRYPPHRARGQWTHGSPREIIKALANDPLVRILVAEKAGRLVGYLAGKFERRRRGRPRRVGHIMETYVIPELRRTGIACALVIEFLERLRRQAVEDVKVQYLVGNRVATSFWNRLGFRPLVTSAHAAPRTIRSRMGSHRRKTRPS